MTIIAAIILGLLFLGALIRYRNEQLNLIIREGLAQIDSERTER